MKRIFLAVLMGISLVAGPAWGEGHGFNFHHKGQPTVYGKTYGEWSAKWFQWAYAGPVGENAVEDETGEFCAAHQPEGRV
jgi:hypothetical protein